MRTAMRSAADIDEVGCPEPAAVLQRMESTRICCPSWRTNSRSVVDCVSVAAIGLPSSRAWEHPAAEIGAGSQIRIRKVYALADGPDSRGCLQPSANGLS